MAGDNPQRIQWLKRQPCALSRDTRHTCCGCIEAHHPRYPTTGMGRRESDDDAIPLCSLAHRAWHSGCGPFKGWTKEDRRIWQTMMVDKYRELWHVQRELAVPQGVLPQELGAAEKRNVF